MEQLEVKANMMMLMCSPYRTPLALKKMTMMKMRTGAQGKKTKWMTRVITKRTTTVIGTG